MKHTPKPGKDVYDSSIDLPLKTRAGGEIVNRRETLVGASFPVGDYIERAEFIVRAVNSHDDLLEALIVMLYLADDGSASFDDPEPDSPYLVAKAAIKKAKGELT